jgi:hypothetical protein
MQCFDMLCNLGKLLKNTFTSHSLIAKARIILDADFSTPSVLLFFQIRIIPFFDLVKFRKLLLLINILTNPSAP